jgi:hypothetical protein
VLTFQITDLDGEVKATLWKRGVGEVSRPVGDSATAKVNLSIYRPEAAHVIPLERMLKVSYLDHLVFWGPILTPAFTFGRPASSIVEIAAHDPTLSWKKNNLRYGDYAVDVGYPLDGLGMAIVAEAALPSPAQIARGVRSNGILEGVDTAVSAGDYPGTIAEGQTAGLWARATRGDSIWDVLQSIASLPQGIGPDWNLRPIDAEHPGALVEWEPGVVAEFNRYERRGVDRQDTVFFQKGFGSESAEELVWTPNGDRVSNYAVVVFPGGEDNAADRRKRRLAHIEAEWLRVGIYESWNSSGSEDYNPDILQMRANAIVDAYGRPPDFITVTPKATAPWRYIDHFTEGDTIRAAAKQGAVTTDVTGRIMGVTLSDTAHGAQTTTAIDIVPRVEAEKIGSDEGG